MLIFVFFLKIVADHVEEGDGEKEFGPVRSFEEGSEGVIMVSSISSFIKAFVSCIGL